VTRANPDFGRLILQAMTAEDPDAAFQAPDGKSYQVDVDPEPGIRRRVRSVDDKDGTGLRFTNWAAAADRHGAFPASAPFLPGVPIMTMERTGAASMTMTSFSHLTQDDGGVERVLAEGRVSGWEDVTLPAGAPSVMATVRMQRRGAMTRSIVEHQDKKAGRTILVTDMPGLISPAQR
jgi:hypothetical protein